MMLPAFGTFSELVILTLSVYRAFQRLLLTGSVICIKMTLVWER